MTTSKAFTDGKLINRRLFIIHRNVRWCCQYPILLTKFTLYGTT